MSASLCKLQKQIFLGEMFNARSGARIMKLPGTEQICVFRCREKGLISLGCIQSFHSKESVFRTAFIASAAPSSPDMMITVPLTAPR